jgi:hypothetical protein
VHVVEGSLATRVPAVDMPMPPTSGNVNRIAVHPWWIGEGSEPCPFCLQGYVLELETRCVACDRPGCMHCMVRVRSAGTVDVRCPECGDGHRAPAPRDDG